MNFNNVLDKSFKSGFSGAGAMTIQVSSLMWLRTTMNYQYKFGGHMLPTIKYLYKEGGILRFYKGYVPALMIGPLSRFGDTFCNSLALNIFKDSYVPLSIQTGTASVLAGSWRILTLPIDAWKTSLQVHGDKGLDVLRDKIRREGVRSLYNGAIASSSATMMGHFPFFYTFNSLDAYLPKYKYKDETLKALGRNAVIGFCSTLMSDTVSNSMRVIKTCKQTHPEKIGYGKIVEEIIKKDGINGLLFRGLQTKIFTNGLQGIVFSVFYKYFSEQFL